MKLLLQLSHTFENQYQLDIDTYDKLVVISSFMISLGPMHSLGKRFLFPKSQVGTKPKVILNSGSNICFQRVLGWYYIIRGSEDAVDVIGQSIHTQIIGHATKSCCLT